MVVDSQHCVVIMADPKWIPVDKATYLHGAGRTREATQLADWSGFLAESCRGRVEQSLRLGSCESSWLVNDSPRADCATQVPLKFIQAYKNTRAALKRKSQICYNFNNPCRMSN